MSDALFGQLTGVRINIVRENALRPGQRIHDYANNTIYMCQQDIDALVVALEKSDYPRQTLMRPRDIGEAGEER